MHRRILLLSGLCLAVSQASAADAPFAVGGVMLLQPQRGIEPRVQSVEALAAYIQRIGGAAQVFFKNHPIGAKAAGYLVIAVKPAQDSNVWIDFSPKIPAPMAEELTGQLRKVPALQVSEGPIVFALQVGLNGAAPPNGQSPMPEEWAAELRNAGRPVEAGELALRVWR